VDNSCSCTVNPRICTSSQSLWTEVPKQSLVLCQGKRLSAAHCSNKPTRSQMAKSKRHSRSTEGNKFELEEDGNHWEKIIREIAVQERYTSLMQFLKSQVDLTVSCVLVFQVLWFLSYDQGDNWPIPLLSRNWNWTEQCELGQSDRKIEATRVSQLQLPRVLPATAVRLMDHLSCQVCLLKSTGFQTCTNYPWRLGWGLPAAFVWDLKPQWKPAFRYVNTGNGWAKLKRTIFEKCFLSIEGTLVVLSR